MIRCINQSAIRFELDAEQLENPKGNYVRKARMYALSLRYAKGDITIKELHDIANEHGMNPEQSNMDSFRQRLHSFQRESGLTVLPINRCFDNMLEHLRIVANGFDTSVSILYKSRKRVYTAARLNIVRRNEDEYGKEVVKLSLERLVIRLT